MQPTAEPARPIAWLTALLLRAGLDPSTGGRLRRPCPACGTDTTGNPTSPDGLCPACWERASELDPTAYGRPATS